MVSEITNHFFHFGIPGDNQVTKPTTAVATTGMSGIAHIAQSWRVSLFATIGPNQLPGLDSGTYQELCSIFVLGGIMFKAVIQEAAALASLALFVGMIAIWSQVISNL